MKNEVTEASLFRKRPVVVQATQWFKNGDHPLDYSKAHDGLENGELRQFSPAERRANDWEGDVVRYYRRPDDSGERRCQHCAKNMHFHGWIDTKEGGHIVCPGDWIITGVQGEHYPCKPSIFAATYEPACSPAPSSPEDAQDKNALLALADRIEAASERPIHISIEAARLIREAVTRAPAAGNALDAARWRHCMTHGFPGLSLWGDPERPVWFYPAPVNEMPVHFDNPTAAVDAALAAQAAQQGEA